MAGKQPGTGLDRATKSIPLAGGITEEVDDFLLEPSGMQYMENLRFTKKDVAEKRRGNKAGVATGLSNYTTDAYGMWSQGTTVALVGNNEVCTSRDSGDSWTTYAQPTDVLGIESVLRTAEAAGGANYSWAPIGNYTDAAVDVWDIVGYVVAFERIEHNPVTTRTIRSVIVQVYDLEGRMIEETTFAGNSGPKCTASDTIAYVNMVDTGGDINSYYVNTSLTLTAMSSDAVDVRLFAPEYNPTNRGFGSVGVGERLFDDMRLGWARDLNYYTANYEQFNRLTDQYGVWGYKTDAAGTIKVTRTFVNTPTGSTATVYTDTSTVFGRLLDVCHGVDNIYVLWSKTNTDITTLQTSIYVTRYNTSLASPSVLTVESAQTCMAINGSIREDSNGDVCIAYTRASGDVEDNMGQTTGDHRTNWRVYDATGWPTPTLNDAGQLYSHRLCSNIAIDKNDIAYFTVQQWANWNPGSAGTAPNDVDIPLITPTHKKPVTTVLVSMTNGTDENRVHATFDAGQSKATLPGMDEQSPHKCGELYYFNAGTDATGAHQFWYGNRVMLRTTDDFFYGSTAAGAAFDGSDARAALHSGAARFSCYRLQSSITVNSTQFTKGMFMGAAVPLWFDGSTEVCSMQPVDSPEIVAFSTSGDGGGYIAYQDAVLVGAEAKMVQVVAGYYDDAGLIHRTAPSQPVYLGNFQAGTTTSGYISLNVSPPLGLARDRAYFLEAYEAMPGGVPQLAATRHVSSNDAQSQQAVQWTTNLDPMAAAKLTDVADYRSSVTIYTAGNVLAADPWPNFGAVVKSGRRLFAVSISDPSTVYYSKTFESGIAPEFSASLTVSLGNESITALGAIDDKVILFTANGCWVMYGAGPDNTGANGDFFIEQMVFPLGCTDHKSILTFEGGIAFFSNTTKEFHVITRDLQVVDIGESVKVISESVDTIRTALLVPFDHELRWYVSRTQGPEYVAAGSTSGKPQPPRPFIENQAPAACVLVYNYKYQKWSVFDDSSPETVQSVVVGTQVGKMSDAYDFYKETDTDFKYSGLCKWETPWIKVNQLQDFGRFYGLTILGKYMSSWDGSPIEAGDLNVEVLYDYEGYGATTHTERFRANVDFDPADGDRLQFRVRPNRQKCQAIKIKFQEVATTAVEVWEPTYTTGQGYILTGVDVHYGAKGGSGDKSLGAQRKKG